jgi:hypothetical protein
MNERFARMHDILAWNTIYTDHLHVYTPVSRNWGQTEQDYTTFVWDVFFAAVMMAHLKDSTRVRDLVYTNMIGTVMSHTMTGMGSDICSARIGTVARQLVAAASPV